MSQTQFLGRRLSFFPFGRIRFWVLVLTHTHLERPEQIFPSTEPNHCSKESNTFEAHQTLRLPRRKKHILRSFRGTPKGNRDLREYQVYHISRLRVAFLELVELALWLITYRVYDHTPKVEKGVHFTWPSAQVASFSFLLCFIHLFFSSTNRFSRLRIREMSFPRLSRELRFLLFLRA